MRCAGLRAAPGPADAPPCRGPAPPSRPLPAPWVPRSPAPRPSARRRGCCRATPKRVRSRRRCVRRRGAHPLQSAHEPARRTAMRGGSRPRPACCRRSAPASARLPRRRCSRPLDLRAAPRAWSAAPERRAALPGRRLPERRSQGRPVRLRPDLRRRRCVWRVRRRRVAASPPGRTPRSGIAGRASWTWTCSTPPPATIGRPL